MFSLRDFSVEEEPSQHWLKAKLEAVWSDLKRITAWVRSEVDELVRIKWMVYSKSARQNRQALNQTIRSVWQNLNAQTTRCLRATAASIYRNGVDGRDYLANVRSEFGEAIRYDWETILLMSKRTFRQIKNRAHISAGALSNWVTLYARELGIVAGVGVVGAASLTTFLMWEDAQITTHPLTTPSMAIVQPVANLRETPTPKPYVVEVIPAPQIPAVPPLKINSRPQPTSIEIEESPIAAPDLSRVVVKPPSNAAPEATPGLGDTPDEVAGTPGIAGSPATEHPAPNPPPTPLHERESDIPRLAIVIDDLGHNLAMPRRLIKLGLPLTYSILPEQPYTAEVVALVRDAGRDFLLHLPMEPKGFPEVDPGKNALLLKLDRATTGLLLKNHLDALRGAIGVNNHMGSAYTNDPVKMAFVQQEVSRRGLIFLNSRTTGSDVPEVIAQKRGYSYLERDVFLDHVRDEKAIQIALDLAIDRARKNGHAVAIGHPYPETLRVLEANLAGNMDRRVRLVSLSEL